MVGFMEATPATLAQVNTTASEIEGITSPSAIPLPAPAIEKLAFNMRELQVATGLSYATIHRLELKGHLRAIPHIRHKLLSKNEVARFLAGKAS